MSLDADPGGSVDPTVAPGGRGTGAGPDGFRQRVLSLSPGASQPVEPADWVDAIVLVAAGVIDVECHRGGRRRFARGDLLWLAGVPATALHNPGTTYAVLVAVSRDRPAAEHPGPHPAG